MPTYFLHTHGYLFRIADHAAEGEAVFLRQRKTQDVIFKNLEIVSQRIKDADIAGLPLHYPEVV